ncbi:DUF4132 domain-containing protein [Streptomyces sp. NBC_00140]|nr:DUF4132 domain-containing protein [Streptomyces sp. NBC_00140]MCX5330139.1 DUF4132 domain-containing protein [Streptomyces sp. NBC_00140]
MLYDDLVRALTDPAFALDVRVADLVGLSDEEVGGLLATAYRARPEATDAMKGARTAVHLAVRDREPRYTPDACRRMFEAVVACSEDPDDVVSLRPIVDALVHCTGPWPDLSGPARALTDFLVEKGDATHPYSLLMVASLGDDEALRTAADLLRRDNGAIAMDGIDVVIALTPAERTLLVQVDGLNTYDPPPNAPDVWRQVAGIPAYVAFARRALEAAADRADAIQRGEIPYRADKAFTPREVDMLGQAARVALLRDEPWLPDLLDRLLPGIAVAPTSAKTVPSQALLYELVRAARDFPTPELVTAIRTARSVTRHAGIPRQLDKLLKQVEPALAERTEVALRLSREGFDDGGVLRREAGSGYTAVVTVTETAKLTWEKDGRPLKSVPAPVRRDHAGLVKELRDLVKRVDIQLGTLARALEGGFTVDAVHPYGWWRAELAGHPLARSAVRRLIWEIEVAPEEWRAVLPSTEDLPDAPDDASVRLVAPDPLRRRHRTGLAGPARRRAAEAAVQAGVPGDLPAHPGGGGDPRPLPALRRPSRALPPDVRAVPGPGLDEQAARALGRRGRGRGPADPGRGGVAGRLLPHVRGLGGRRRGGLDRPGPLRAPGGRRLAGGAPRGGAAAGVQRGDARRGPLRRRDLDRRRPRLDRAGTGPRLLGTGRVRRAERERRGPP